MASHMEAAPSRGPSKALDVSTAKPLIPRARYLFPSPFLTCFSQREAFSVSPPDSHFASLSTKCSTEPVDQAPAKKLKVSAATQMQSQADNEAQSVQSWPLRARLPLRRAPPLPRGAAGEEGTGVGEATDALGGAGKASGATEPGVEERVNTGLVATPAPLMIERAPMGPQEAGTVELQQQLPEGVLPSTGQGEAGQEPHAPTRPEGSMVEVISLEEDEEEGPTMPERDGEMPRPPRVAEISPHPGGGEENPRGTSIGPCQGLSDGGRPSGHL